MVGPKNQYTQRKPLHFENTARSNVVGIICPLGWDRVDLSLKIAIFKAKCGPVKAHAIESSLEVWNYILKVASEEILPLPCKCSILLSPTFVEIKNSFTKTLLDFNSKNFGIICYWKNTNQNERIICFIAL